jgi:hypothetical protein
VVNQQNGTAAPHAQSIEQAADAAEDAVQSVSAYEGLQNGLFPQGITPLHASKRDLWVLPSNPLIVGVLIKTGGDLDPLIAGMVAATAIILGRKRRGCRGRPAVLIARPDKVNATVPEIQSRDRAGQIDPNRIAVRR